MGEYRTLRITTFDLDGPATVENIKLACNVENKRFVL